MLAWQIMLNIIWDVIRPLLVPLIFILAAYIIGTHSR